ncbi:MAG: sugar nucleotide-binding protein, partial [Candidatus Omnitrophica bacterium]|nr:sugar nucleotide-binding protein [Candidatus Omnitrophota bacterium]
EPRILIFGKGFNGERLAREFNAATTERMIQTLNDAQEEYNKYKPDIIINCIGYTGKNNVDDCELEKDMTLTANTFVPIILAEVALRNKIKLVHISSGCIYHYDYKKSKPVTEDEIPYYFDLFYSRSKIYSERALEVLSMTYNILITRIRIPLDDRPHPKNIINKLVKYGKVIDVPNSVTYIPDFVQAVRHLIKIDAKGIYNVVNEGGLRYPKLMEIYKKYVPDFNFEVIDYRKLGLVRTNLLMSTRKLEKSGFKIRKIDDILEECVRTYLGKN